MVTLWQSAFFASLTFDAVLVAAALRRRRSEKKLLRSLSAAGLLALGIVSSVFVTVFLLYCTWTSVGADRVMGVQQRYFFSHLILALGALVVLAYRGDAEVGATPPETASRIKSVAVAIAGAVLLAIGVVYLVGIAGDLAARYW
jgi:hypothetical protein